jgi:hypothetical protein
MSVTPIKDQSDQTFYGDYYPILLSRRGEFVAWGSLLLLTTGWLILLVSDRDVPSGVAFLLVFLLFSGMGISLGNWMDRKTIITISEESVSFKNGLRNTNLNWTDIQRIEVTPSKWGKKVRVIGTHSYFDFRSIGEISVFGDVKGRMGFEKGDKILDMIILKTGLIKFSLNDSRYYYSHK